MRTEIIWTLGILMFSVLLVAVSTSFKFSLVEVQLHDTYVSLGSVQAIIILSILLIIARYTFQAVIFFIHRHKAVAIITALIVPFITYLIIAYIYLIGSIISAMAGDSDIRVQQNAWVVYIPILFFILSLIAIEIIAIKKIASKKL